MYKIMQFANMFTLYLNQKTCLNHPVPTHIRADDNFHILKRTHFVAFLEIKNTS